MLLLPEKCYILQASEYINKSKVVLISEGSKYIILKSSISNEMKSLLHYIEWRLENSYAMIVWKTIKLAEDIITMKLCQHRYLIKNPMCHCLMLRNHLHQNWLWSLQNTYQVKYSSVHIQIVTIHVWIEHLLVTI